MLQLTSKASAARVVARHMVATKAAAVRLALLQLAVTALLLTPAVFAESQTFGDYTVHYIAVNSTFISPEIAQQYDIERNRRGAFLNIAVLKNNADGTTTPVTAAVSGGKQNLLQQSGAIDFQEVREGAAIYYLGQFEFSNAELLRFRVSVQPEQQGPVHQIEWTSTLYAD
jgi:hypothetical protein